MESASDKVSGFPREKSFSTHSNRIYLRLRDQIVRGMIPSGSRLVRRKLSQQFGVSPIPVTEAIFSLEQDGLVESEPMYGARVRVMTGEGLQNEQMLREAIECQTARLFAERATPAQQQNLFKKAVEFDTFQLSSDKSTLTAATNLHLDFHMTIARQTGFPLLEKELQRIWFRHLLIVNTVNAYLHPTPPTWHRDLVEALATGDPDVAEKKMREHARYGLDHKMEALKKAEQMHLLDANQ